MIKKFTQHDIDEIMDIWLATNVSAHPFIHKAHWAEAYDLVKSLLPAADVFVWREHNAIKGFIGITDKVYVAGLFVRAQFQSQGIGKKLLDHCKTRFRSLELDVFTQNANAVCFYQKNGFTIEGTKMNPDFGRREHHMIWFA